MVVILPYCIKAKRCEHNALGYWSGLALCLTKVRSSRARCPATALIVQFFIAPAYSRVRYRSSNFRPSVRSFVRPFVRSSVRSFVRQHLRRSLVFSTSEIVASLKPCIVIVPDIPFKHAP